MFINDTIAAIATPPGTGGVAIIRISGPEALGIAQSLFRVGSRPIDPPLMSGLGRELHVGHVVDPATGVSIDEVVMLVFRAPRSYTTEDVVELQGHAGSAVVQRLLALVLRHGARLAAPGEFTKRAFLGGRIDLTQAEAIIDISSARTERALSAALGTLEGALAHANQAMRQATKHLLAELEAAIDFPDEIDPPDPERLRETLQTLRHDAEQLLSTASGGRLLREGATLAIIGRPNVGKSSLLNALLRAERAIVTDMAGTTRDVLEAGLMIGGVPFRLLDTAGIRTEGVDIAEALGIARSHASLEEADVRLVVVDASQEPSAADLEILAQAQAAGLTLLVGNKRDRGLAPGWAELVKLSVSASSGAGLVQLEQAIYEGAVGAALLPIAGIAINARQRSALERARDAFLRALTGLDSQIPVDLLTIDLKAAVEALGEIAGDELAEEVIDHIFASFCVGK